MATVVGYERPGSLGEALELLVLPGTAPLAGGTALSAAPSPQALVVVDLQHLPLDRIEQLDDAALRIGATATLQAIAEAASAPATVREAARRELPSTLRAVATVGGCLVAGGFESELLAILLVHEARVTLAGADGEDVVELEELLRRGGPRRGQLITGLTIAASGRSAVARTARTRADRAIVAAAARTTPSGRVLLALSGVADRPRLVTDVDELEPPGDHRGSAEYRLALAATLAERAVTAVAG